jgi:hypothetical protein
MTVQDFVDSIATKAGVDPATAETAIGTILSAIQQEGDATKVVNCSTKFPARQILLRSMLSLLGLVAACSDRSAASQAALSARTLACWSQRSEELIQ